MPTPPASPTALTAAATSIFERAVNHTINLPAVLSIMECKLKADDNFNSSHGTRATTEHRLRLQCGIFQKQPSTTATTTTSTTNHNSDNKNHDDNNENKNEIATTPATCSTLLLILPLQVVLPLLLQHCWVLGNGRCVPCASRASDLYHARVRDQS